MMKHDRGLQDGMLQHYLEQARASDGNVEPRLEREPFDYREYLRRVEESLVAGASRKVTKRPTR